MNYSIRCAGSSDWAAVREIRLRALVEEPTAYASSYDREINLDRSDWQERLATACTFLATGAEGEQLGLATGVWMRDGDMALMGMYVAPSVRGTGLAHALIDEVVNMTERRHGIRVVLSVAEGNESAGRSYRRYGFRPTGRVRIGESASQLVEHEYAYVLTVAASRA